MQPTEPSHPHDMEVMANDGTPNDQQEDHHQFEKSELPESPGNANNDENMLCEVAVPARPHRKYCCCCSLRKILYVLIPLSILMAGIVVWMAAFSPSGLQNPFVGTDPPGAAGATPWNSSGRGGLTLLVENALETRYDAIFDEYIAKWQQSNALSLTVSRLAHESECVPSDGRLKVCNGNYGSTDWEGLTSYLLQDGKMQSAVVQLNDYFLDKGGSVKQRYTMCHELGHGWGLAHTDENYWNRNRGDCMDYAEFPRSNLEPGQYNFDLLQKLYGTVGGGNTTSGGLRSRRTNLDEEAAGLQENRVIIPESVMQKYKNIAFAQTTAAAAGHDADYYVDLGEKGYTIKFHKF